MAAFKLELVPLPTTAGQDAGARTSPGAIALRPNIEIARAADEGLSPEALAQRFRRTLPERYRHTTELCQALLRDPGNRRAGSRLIRSLAALRSAAQAYGFAAIAATAEEIEQSLEEAPDSQLRSLRSDFDRLLQMLDPHSREALSASDSDAAPIVWLDPPEHEQLAWLCDLLGVGGYQVRPAAELSGAVETHAPCHLLVMVLPDIARGTAALAEHARRLRGFGAPFQIMVLCDADSIESRLALSAAGAGLVLPSAPDRAQTMRVLETEIASMSGSAPTVALLTLPGLPRSTLEDELMRIGVRVRNVSSLDALWRTTHALEADAVVVGTGVDLSTVIDLVQVVRQDEQNIQLPFLALGFSNAPPAALLEAGIEAVHDPCAPADLAVIVRDRLMRRRRRVLGSRRDGLTGTLTRLAFAHAMKALLDGQWAWVAFAIVDLDNFKAINEELGHVGGDRVLRETARRIRAAVPSSGSVGRFGGDEFVVALPARSESEARRMLAHVAQVGQQRLMQGAESARFSVGALLLDRADRSHHVDLELLTTRADNLLGDSKSAGKGRLTVSFWRDDAEQARNAQR